MIQSVVSVQLIMSFEAFQRFFLCCLAGCQALQANNIKSICVEPLGDAEAAAEGSLLSTWKYQEFKTKKTDIPTVNLYDPNETKAKCLWGQGIIKANSQNLARRLADTPSNFMTPSIFAENVQEALCSLGVDVAVHDQKWAEEKKMGSFLSVSRGSQEPLKFLHITYKGGCEGDSPYVLVGKGVTFDSGGISLKPGTNMDHMRADMGGAACVVGTLEAIAKLKLKTNVSALIPLCENMPSGTATKPGDVVRAMNGKTICVDNTDAEGRLILADALCYSATLKPKWVLDIATLTGAMVVCLGNVATGVFCNSSKLFTDLEHAGAVTGDRMWRFPLWKTYTKQISDFAAFDLNNIGKGKGGGSCTAAAFLKEFIPEKTDWMHLDIASVMGPESDLSYLEKGMTGRPTRTLVQFLQDQSEKV